MSVKFESKTHFFFADYNYSERKYENRLEIPLREKIRNLKTKEVERK